MQEVGYSLWEQGRKAAVEQVHVSTEAARGRCPIALGALSIDADEEAEDPAIHIKELLTN